MPPLTGYQGKALHVDLTDRKISVLDLDHEDLRSYMGGAGMAVKLLYEQTGIVTDPLSPENPLIAFTGPFTSTIVPSSSRHHIVARSLLTGLLGESSVGGSWGVHFKKTGYDGLVLTGKADRPVYLWISDQGVDLREAKEIWGQGSHQSDERNSIF